MALIAMAIPILPGQEAEWRKFSDELKTKWMQEFKDSRSRAGVRERTYLQHTPMGDMVIVTLEGDNPGEAFGKMFSEDTEFNRWMGSMLGPIHGMAPDPAQMPPVPELIVDSGS